MSCVIESADLAIMFLHPYPWSLLPSLKSVGSGFKPDMKRRKEGG